MFLGTTLNDVRHALAKEDAEALRNTPGAFAHDISPAACLHIALDLEEQQ